MDAAAGPVGPDTGHAREAVSLDKRAASPGELVGSLSAQITRLVRSEIALAMAEIKPKIKFTGIGAGLFAAAGVFAFFAVGVLIATVVLVIHLFLPAWLSALIVGAAFLLLAGLLVLIGLRLVKRAMPPVPKQAIASIQQDIAAAKEGAKR